MQPFIVLCIKGQQCQDSRTSILPTITSKLPAKQQKHGSHTLIADCNCVACTAILDHVKLLDTYTQVCQDKCTNAAI